MLLAAAAAAVFLASHAAFSLPSALTPFEIERAVNLFTLTHSASRLEKRRSQSDGKMRRQLVSMVSIFSFRVVSTSLFSARFAPASSAPRPVCIHFFGLIFSLPLLTLEAFLSSSLLSLLLLSSSLADSVGHELRVCSR